EVNIKISPFLKKVSKKDMAVFCRQFYTMLNAGISVINCLDILEKQIENKMLEEAISSVRDNLQKGMTLSESMKKHNGIFPPLLTNMIEVGETGGTLDII